MKSGEYCRYCRTLCPLPASDRCSLVVVVAYRAISAYDNDLLVHRAQALVQKLISLPRATCLIRAFTLTSNIYLLHTP